MNDEPVTNPHDKISLARDDYRFRMFVIESMTRMETTLKLHTDDDQRRFESIEERLSATGNAVSGINTEKAQFIGSKNTAIWILSISLVILGLYAAWPR